MKSIPKVFIISMLLFLLPGCWDYKDIRQTNYVTAIGMDYQDQQFNVFVQLLDFTFIAKTEGQPSSKSEPSTIGRGYSPSLDLAFHNLYRSIQNRTNWANTSSLVISDKAFKSQGGLFFLDLISRFPEFRLTPWIFGSKEPLDKLLSAKAFFGLSAKESIIYNPMDIYEQHSEIKPLQLNDYGANILEPAQTVLLPTLSLDRTSWKESDKTKAKPIIDGVFLFYKGVYKGWLGINDLLGLRWLEKETKRTPVSVKKGDSEWAVITLKNQGVHVTSNLKENLPPNYDIEVQLNGTVIETHGEFTLTDLQDLAAKWVAQEITETFRKGLAIDVDVFNLEHYFFKQHPHVWRNTPDSKRIVQGQSLGKIHVVVNIVSTGKSRLEQIEKIIPKYQ